MKNLDEKWMTMALKLARKGGRAVAPNPMVGAVIVKNKRVIGKGYHQKFGGPHAEINAIQSVKRKADVEGATMYVTLEPCRHFGKTPPCWDFISVMGIKRVVCGSADPTQQGYQSSEFRVQIEFLKGPIARECRNLNKFFFTWAIKKRPFVTVKVAMSADGFVAGEDGKPIRFTTAKQDREVHQLRAEHQAIMVGINTISDDPRLTVRHVKGPDPLRVILDTHFRIPKNAKVLKDKNYLIATVKKRSKMNVWKSPTKTKICLKRLLKKLANDDISSVLVEPGPTLYQSLKKQGLIDELVVYRSKKKLKEGLKIDL